MNNINKIKKIAFLLLFSVLLIIPDQLTKQLAVAKLKDQAAVTLINNVLYFTYLENRGAAFGSLQGAQTFFYIITVVVLVLILNVVWRMPDRKRFVPLYITALLIFSGAIGNFIDRVSQRYVVDFIYFSPIDFPVFNVADIYVSVGCGLMIFLFLFIYKEEELDFLWLKKAPDKKIPDKGDASDNKEAL